MDYKEKLREIINSNSEYYPSEDKAAFAKYFPELKESDEERIRKEFCEAIWTYIPCEKAHEYIAWLEKQGESDETKAKMFLINKGYPIDTNGIFPTYEEMYNIIIDGLKEQNPAWSEKDKNLLNRLIGVLDGTNEEDYHEGWEETFLPWLKSLKERM